MSSLCPWIHWIGYDYAYGLAISMAIAMAIPRCLYQYEYIISDDKYVAKVCT